MCVSWRHRGQVEQGLWMVDLLLLVPLWAPQGAKEQMRRWLQPGLEDTVLESWGLGCVLKLLGAWVGPL